MIINDKKGRIYFFRITIIIIAIIFIIRLIQLQIIEGDYYSEIASSNMLQEVSIEAPRGDIITSDGVTLATNRTGYTVEITEMSLEDDELNSAILELVNILEKNSEEYEDSLPILIDSNENYYFDYDDELTEWKQENNIPVEYDAEETLTLLREKYSVKEEVSDSIAIDAISEVYLDGDLPITLYDTSDDDEDENLVVMFTYDIEMLEWKENHYFDEDEYNLNAEESFDKLIELYDISDSYTIQQQRKIMVIRELLFNQGYRSWEAVTISTDVQETTVYEIDAIKEDLPGIDVVSDPIRVYPYGSLAAHIIGYITPVTETDVEENGYDLNEMKGANGLEAAMEEYLKGINGSELVLTDYTGSGTVSSELEALNTSPEAGDNVITTINYELQVATENALSEQLEYLQSSGVASNAASGAAVVIDVNSGAVLAMASYPTYDLNLFSNGISSEDWDALNVEGDNDLSPRPLYNNATSTALQPGSTFKPLMSITGLENGIIDASSTYYCNGTDPLFPQFTCLGAHGSETVVDAIRDSCNVFFYQLAYYTGIDIINDSASQFGLGEETGIEIYESTGYLAGREEKEEIWTDVTTSYLKSTVGIQGQTTITNDDGEEIDVSVAYSIAKELFDAVPDDDSLDYAEMYALVSETVLPYNIKDTDQLHKLTEYVLAGQWVPSDALNTGIGQGGTSVTPVQLANYIATLVNGGTHYKVHLVDEVVSQDGEVIYENEPEVLNTISISEENLELVKQGMKQVTLYSTGAAAFTGFDHTNIGVGGKTGTAEYGDDSIENTAWFTCFTPYEEPEIAVAVMVVQGEISSNAVPIARTIVDAYFEIKETSGDIIQ